MPNKKQKVCVGMVFLFSDGFRQVRSWKGFKPSLLSYLISGVFFCRKTITYHVTVIQGIISLNVTIACVVEGIVSLNVTIDCVVEGIVFLNVTRDCVVEGIVSLNVTIDCVVEGIVSLNVTIDCVVKEFLA